jgi:hypothetical protein
VYSEFFKITLPSLSFKEKEESALTLSTFQVKQKTMLWRNDAKKMTLAKQCSAHSTTKAKGRNDAREMKQGNN